MAILAYLSGRCSALWGSGMRSNCADSFSATHLQSGLRTQAALSRKSGTHCAAEKPHQRAPNRTGTVAHDLCAGPLHTTFAHDLCASSIPHISFLNLRLGIVHSRFQCSTRGGVRCCTRGGQNGGSDPPVCALRAALTPGCNAHHVGQCRPPYGGGRSRHNDPCGKARIAEG